MNDMLEMAINLANRHHAGQVDKGGNPYILHPLAVMNSVDTLEEKIVAILHDIIEDTECTIDTLKLHFTDEIVEAIDLLTKKERQTTKDYIESIAKNKLAKKVKIADMKHNMDLNRIKYATEKDYKRVERYRKLLDKLI